MRSALLQSEVNAMAESKFIYATEDVPQIASAFVALQMSLVADERYDTPTFRSVSATEFLEIQSLPKRCYAYMLANADLVSLDKIEMQPPHVGHFFCINAHAVPEHLEFSAFLRDAGHAGFFGMFFRATFLNPAGPKRLDASTSLRRCYRNMKANLVRHARTVTAGKQTFVVMKHASRRLIASEISSTYGDNFDLEVRRALIATAS